MSAITRIRSRYSSPISCSLLTILILSLVSAVFAAEPAAKSPPDTTGWKELFAPDLSNAILPTNSWVMENGVLVAKDHETIWTKESYGNFVLDLDFKLAEDANSGVFLRSGNIKNVLGALEIQVHASTDGSKYGMVGALYDAKPPSKNAAKPVGEWNHYTITCRDSHISLVFNGEQVLDVNLDDWTEVKKNPDGTPNKFAKALKDFSRKGPIGLQGLHGKAAAPVWYRNLKIKNLDGRATSQILEPSAVAGKSKLPMKVAAALPHVLIIGDSISIGYTPFVQAALKGEADVQRIPGNGRMSANGLKLLSSWLGTQRWDVITFNFGLHDAKFASPGKQQGPPAEYEANLRELVKRLQATGAKLVWCSTTPVPPGELIPSRQFSDIGEYNRIATKVMTENHVVINDLNTFITPHVAEYQTKQDVHFAKAGYEALGGQVAAAIRAQLPKQEK